MTEEKTIDPKAGRDKKGRFTKDNQVARGRHTVREITQEVRAAAREKKVLMKTFKNLAEIATGKREGATASEQIAAAKVLAQYNLTSADKEIDKEISEDTNKTLAENFEFLSSLKNKG
ncbi:TPA: hypothetical protein OUD88_002872 [Enterobacter hormaechei]|nr:hypothetical protein [Enterobacter hormaechei]